MTVSLCELVPDTKTNCRLRIRDCGLAGFGQVLQLQHKLVRQRQSGEISNTVLMAEHKPVITLGARALKNRLLVGSEVLAQRRIDLVTIRRGGGTTAHNPGQLVFYPILDLRGLGLGVSEYIRRLEQIGIELLEQLGVKSERRKGFPGLWVGEKKVASIGVRVSKGVTFHGMAINITNDLSIFDMIIPCGLDGLQMTSVLKETGKRHSMSQVKRQLVSLLTSAFGP